MADLDSYIVSDTHNEPGAKDANAAKHALSQAVYGKPDEKAPDSAMGRYGTWLADGIKDLPAGVWHSVQRDFGSAEDSRALARCSFPERRWARR